MSRELQGDPPMLCPVDFARHASIAPSAQGPRNAPKSHVSRRYLKIEVGNLLHALQMSFGHLPLTVDFSFRYSILMGTTVVVKKYLLPW